MVTSWVDAWNPGAFKHKSYNIREKGYFLIFAKLFSFQGQNNLQKISPINFFIMGFLLEIGPDEFTIFAKKGILDFCKNFLLEKFPIFLF